MIKKVNGFTDKNKHGGKNYDYSTQHASHERKQNVRNRRR